MTHSTVLLYVKERKGNCILILHRHAYMLSSKISVNTLRHLVEDARLEMKDLSVSKDIIKVLFEIRKQK